MPEGQEKDNEINLKDWKSGREDIGGGGREGATLVAVGGGVGGGPVRKWYKGIGKYREQIEYISEEKF